MRYAKRKLNKYVEKYGVKDKRTLKQSIKTDKIIKKFHSKYIKHYEIWWNFSLMLDGCKKLTNKKRYVKIININT